jgi:hypothetical protein
LHRNQLWSPACFAVYMTGSCSCRSLQASLPAKGALLSATAKSLTHKEHVNTEELSNRTQAIDDVACKLSLEQKGLESRITALEKRLNLELDEEGAPARHLLATYSSPAETASSCMFLDPLPESTRTGLRCLSRWCAVLERSCFDRTLQLQGSRYSRQKLHQKSRESQHRLFERLYLSPGAWSEWRKSLSVFKARAWQWRKRAVAPQDDWKILRCASDVFFTHQTGSAGQVFRSCTSENTDIVDIHLNKHSAQYTASHRFDDQVECTGDKSSAKRLIVDNLL